MQRAGRQRHRQPLVAAAQRLYDRLRRPARGGYGLVLSVRFTRPAAAVAFHDDLDVARGPSFGATFTLACPYTVLTHYLELGWAARHGLGEHLVRINVGLEDAAVLRAAVDRALAAAERCL